MDRQENIQLYIQSDDVKYILSLSLSVSFCCLFTGTLMHGRFTSYHTMAWLFPLAVVWACVCVYACLLEGALEGPYNVTATAAASFSVCKFTCEIIYQVGSISQSVGDNNL